MHNILLFVQFCFLAPIILLVVCDGVMRNSAQKLFRLMLKSSQKTCCAKNISHSERFSRHPKARTVELSKTKEGKYVEMGRVT